MEQIPYWAEMQQTGVTVWEWLLTNVFVLGNAVQLGLVLVVLITGRLVRERFSRWVRQAANSRVFEKTLSDYGWAKALIDGLETIAVPAFWFLSLWIMTLVASSLQLRHHLMQSVVGLITAWIVIRLAATVIRNPAWARALALIAWTIAALNLVGLLGPLSLFLDGLALELGETRISVLGLLKGAAALAFLLWAAGFISQLIEGRLKDVEALTPSVQVLFGKLTRIILFTLALLMALNSVGIDLTALAVFSGAVGLGVGFGLQKVVSNLISGVILLLDKSVKPGDVIALGESFGWINKLSARYVSVITRDGTEHLIPNEELISQRVENWSFTDSKIRLPMMIGVAYETDVPKAMELCVEAAKVEDRVLKMPEPVCRLVGFGDSAINLELRIWIEDPQNGMANVRSNIYLRIWELFKEHDVKFPFPQQDVHIKEIVPVRMEVAKEGKET